MTTPVETVELAPGYAIPRIIVGGWQLSPGHSAVSLDRERGFEILRAFAEAGLTCFDCADIYTGVEELLGEFRERYRNERDAGAAERIQVHTKFVPDRSELPRISRRYVERIIDRSLTRLRVERLDLVQFHWWDYDVPGCLETAGWLGELQQAGKIRLLGATNFGTSRLAALLDGGVRFASHQVQYSVLDRRPAGPMAELGANRGVTLLCYGGVAGGFLSERYLGAPEPSGELPNRSLVKYRLIIEEFGGWLVFQGLLATLAEVARRHGATIATVATRWVLDQPQVGAVIVGARDATHLEQNLRTFALRLDPEDRGRIEESLARHPGPTGDVYELERIPGARHAAIMRYDLNREA
ncbi:MAG: aldo/keto reductase [Gemmatimonadetes bacterium]|nr:aldo/keto reductase [Gemmatimonadota bacterium]